MVEAGYDHLIGHTAGIERSRFSEGGVEAVEAGFEGGDDGGEIGELSLEASEALVGALGAEGGSGAGLGGFRQSAEQMGVAGFAGAGLTREDCGEGAGAGGVGGYVAGCKTLKGGLDGGDVVEGVETLGAAAELAGGLRAAEDEEAEDGGLVAAEIKDGADAVLVLGDAGVVNGGGEREVFQGVEGLANFVFGELEDGVAAGFLVAGVDQSVEREGVVLWGGNLFFDESSEDTELGGVEPHTD
jgi:hypothetical protein